MMWHGDRGASTLGKNVPESFCKPSGTETVQTFARIKASERILHPSGSRNRFQVRFPQ